MFDTLKKGKTEQMQAKAKAENPPTAMVHSGVLSDLQTTHNCEDGNTEILPRPNINS